tara:strand:- start:4 stop:240 length:237 start_codon:yes stop_codon:yes gene_type:complete
LVHFSAPKKLTTSKAVDNFNDFKTLGNNLGSVFLIPTSVIAFDCTPQFSKHRTQSSTLLAGFIAYPNTFHTSFPDLFP